MSQSHDRKEFVGVEAGCCSRLVVGCCSTLPIFERMPEWMVVGLLGRLTAFGKHPTSPTFCSPQCSPFTSPPPLPPTLGFLSFTPCSLPAHARTPGETAVHHASVFSFLLFGPPCLALHRPLSALAGPSSRVLLLSYSCPFTQHLLSKEGGSDKSFLSS
jgi:hypothetical protein